MWNPFLARSLRSLFGRRRHAVPPPCGADRFFSRAYTSREPETGGVKGTSRSSRPHQPRRRNLYVVLRDWESMGYSFHKLNLDKALEDMNGGASEGNGGASDGNGGMNGAQNLRRLPEPILRIGPRRMGPRALFHALGSNIVITGSAYGSKDITLVYDTEAGELEFAEGLPDEFNGWYYDAVAAGDKLHALHFPHYLWDRKVLPPAESMSPMEKPWTWACSGRSPIPKSTRAGAGYRLTAHALHPDGRTVFVSMDHIYPDLTKEPETISLDTESGEWTHRGNWRLPFHGQGHYDGELEAWVDVKRGSHECPPRRHENYLCSCDVPALGDGSTARPSWKLCEKKLTFIEAPLVDKEHGPVLVHAGNGTLCLVETASSAREKAGCLRVTMFRPKYGKNGELVMAAAPRAARSYVIPSAVNLSFNGAAFWM